MTIFDGTDDYNSTQGVSGVKLNTTVVWKGTALPVGAANEIPQNGLFLLVDSLSAPTVSDWYLQTSATTSSPAFVKLGAAEAPGIIKDFAGLAAQIPAGYLRCDGAEVSRTTYADLFAAIGTEWGVGNGTTTFDLPDFEGDNSFARAADQDSELAGSGGEGTHALTEAELAAHTHTGGAHTHDVTARADTTSSNEGVLNGATNGGGNLTRTTTSAGAVATTSTGSGTAHENKPPYKSVYKIIKY